MEATSALKPQRDLTTKIKGVIFDCGGVLAGNVPSRMLKTLAQRYPEEQRDTIQYWNNIKSMPEYKEADYWQDFKTMVKQVREPVEELQQMLQESYYCYTECLELAKQVKASGWLDQIATKFGFYDVFNKDLVIVSQTVRSAKPAKAIYEVTLAKLREELGEDLQASEVLFIDDKQENIATASELGMLGFCFNAHAQPSDVLKQALIDLHLLPKA
ncbi:HAD hydrolase, family IA, variant 3 subfamily protein [Acanthamoeba castellanii str. Neff]|uniref:HAD hydrolase, family IA, variant 3 subfamily protein n=1 Tax=Acanthamoeba castellanii (strain ATCC 30010 / Neff) TaxID=1257118 RepID=L8GPI3_ACACF|nr:HAD hydrolase, family IA, variant 3 subfamily protein [Acanthamoeba castellanii str. Neff]ELR15069.1 HAD hydrolase, family IA, variant 3 subfamily protein [Acanthamoeba castellanii str. Neff]